MLICSWSTKNLQPNLRKLRGHRPQHSSRGWDVGRWQVGWYKLYLLVIYMITYTLVSVVLGNSPTFVGWEHLDVFDIFIFWLGGVKKTVTRQQYCRMEASCWRDMVMGQCHSYHFGHTKSDHLKKPSIYEAENLDPGSYVRVSQHDSSQSHWESVSPLLFGLPNFCFERTCLWVALVGLISFSDKNFVGSSNLRNSNKDRIYPLVI